MCQAAHGGVVESLWRSCEFDGGAEVDTAAECEMVCWTAIEAKRVGLVEVAGVAIGGREQEHDP